MPPIRKILFENLYRKENIHIIFCNNMLDSLHILSLSIFCCIYFATKDFIVKLPVYNVDSNVCWSSNISILNSYNFKL